MVCLHGQKGFNSPSHKRRRARTISKFFPFSLRLLLGVLAYGHSITSHWHEAAQTRSGSVGQRGALVLLSRFPIHIAIATEEDEKKPIWSVVSLVPRARAFAFCTGSSNRTRSRQSSEHCPSALAIAKKKTNNNNNDNNEEKKSSTHTSRTCLPHIAPSSTISGAVHLSRVLCLRDNRAESGATESHFLGRPRSRAIAMATSPCTPHTHTPPRCFRAQCPPVATETGS